MIYVYGYADCNLPMNIRSVILLSLKVDPESFLFRLREVFMRQFKHMALNSFSWGAKV